MRDIFISYRREDTQGHAGRLWDRLRASFGEDRVYYDQAVANAGEDWSKQLEVALSEAQIVVALIGSNWLDSKNDQGQRRLDVESDVVRRELAASLRTGKTVIPVLIDHQRNPSSEELPSELGPLGGAVQYQILHSQEDLYDAGVDQLIALIRRKIDCAFVLAPELCPEKLPYLCNRSLQEEKLGEALEMQNRHFERFSRPMLWVVYGVEGEAHGPFLDRLEFHSLPKRLQLLGLVPSVQFLRIRDCPRFNGKQGFARWFRKELADELQVPECETNTALLAGLKARRVTLLAPTIVMSAREAQQTQWCCLDMLHDFWVEFPDLPCGLIVMCFVALKFTRVRQGHASNLLRRVFSLGRHADGDSVPILRHHIKALAERSDPSASVVCHVFPELCSITPEDVDRWAQAQEVSRYVRHVSDQRRREIFGNSPALPMDDVIDRLGDLITVQAAARSHS